MEKREKEGFSYQSIALTELVSYIESCRNDSTRPLFKMMDLRETYKKCLMGLGETEAGANTTRLREKLCKEVPDLVLAKEPCLDPILTLSQL